MKYILIKADTNDADYVTSFKPIQLEDEQFIKEIVNKIKNGRSISWKTGELFDGESLQEQYPILTEEEIELLDNYVPHGDYGVHTIDDIEIYEILSVETLL